MKRIDILPDDVLLDIFDFYVNLPQEFFLELRKEEVLWQSLVHVCRRWRNLVFGSPRRLKLRLHCSPEKTTRDTLDLWPALPLAVHGGPGWSSGTDNVIAALGQSNRVGRVSLAIPRGELEEVLAAMQVPFPELTRMSLSSRFGERPVIPDSFLGGSAPRLEYFQLDGIPIPGLPNLLLSATQLVTLYLYNIPDSGYISPEAMVALLSVLSNLKKLSLAFESPQSRPDWESRNLRPPKLSILPVLSDVYFRGVTEYLEDLVTSIDTPQLDHLIIRLLDSSDFDCPRLAQFIDRIPTLRAVDEAQVEFRKSEACLELRYRTFPAKFQLCIPILCREPDRQLSSIVQFCNSSLYPLSTVEDLYIKLLHKERVWKNDAAENTLWLRLLLPFTAVKEIHLSAYDYILPGIATAMEELVGARKKEVLPSLQCIHKYHYKEEQWERNLAARRSGTCTYFTRSVLTIRLTSFAGDGGIGIK
jgi:hypothetical protein